MEKIKAQGRMQEVDIAKGLACLLMIAAHFISAKLLPFGTFAAPLFFACSGMNTILLIEKTRGNKYYDIFHVLFPLILFFGGSTQVVIFFGGNLRVAPEFLQFIALAVLLLFALSKFFKNPRDCGILFPVPFLVQQLLPWSFMISFEGSPLAFVFGRGFALFPWLGFFLFGVFLLSLKRNLLYWLQGALAAAFVLSRALFNIPLNKFWTTLPYIFLALLATAIAFSLARWITGQAGRIFFKCLAELFALPGRNALMFLYLHYFVLRYFVSSDFFPSFYWYLFIEPLYLLLVCIVFLKLYEKLKNEVVLFFPVLALTLALAGLRWEGLLAPRSDLRLVDMVIGILFAFLYVQLRRKAASFIRTLNELAAAGEQRADLVYGQVEHQAQAAPDVPAGPEHEQPEGGQHQGKDQGEHAGHLRMALEGAELEHGFAGPAVDLKENVGRDDGHQADQGADKTADHEGHGSGEVAYQKRGQAGQQADDQAQATYSQRRGEDDDQESGQDVKE
jgi:hypothetical protein